MKNPDYIVDYLNHIGIANKYKAKEINCEFCGFYEFSLVRDVIDVGKGKFAKLPVVSCNRCGGLFQNPRFPREFYKEFYSKKYRDSLYGDLSPSKSFIDDQFKRGKLLYKSLQKYLPKKRNLKILDVGCSSGGMMKSFIEKGWKGYGTDPDVGYVKYGKDVLNLPVEVKDSEEMELEKNSFDLIIIMGSLEHVFDPNKTLEICRKAAKPNSLLLLEGRGHPQKESKIYFNHNHHRYLTLNSMSILMLRHGWKPILRTDEELTGPTRKGGIFCLGKSTKILNKISMLKNSQVYFEKSEDIINKFNVLDKKLRKAI